MSRSDLLIKTSASVDVSAAVTGDQNATVAASEGLSLVGFAARETAGTAAVATFRIMNGATVAGGTEINPVELNGNESTSDWFGPEGIDASNGLTIDHIAGTFDCMLFYKAVP